VQFASGLPPCNRSEGGCLLDAFHKPDGNLHIAKMLSATGNESGTRLEGFEPTTLGSEDD